MRITVPISIDIDMRDVFENMDLSQQWDLLQYVWDEIRKSGGEEDWTSFYEENGISPRRGGEPFVCPKCGSEETNSLDLNLSVSEDSGQQIAIQIYYCLDCGAKWKDYYTHSKTEISTDAEE